MARVHAVILAGGSGRMGGTTKADLQLGGKRLLDWVLSDLEASDLVTGARVVVAPPHVRVPAHVQRTLEDPPAGGPVAGIFAGLGKAGARSEDIVWLATCDAPYAAAALPRLHAQLLRAGHAIDAVIAIDDRGREQYLLGAYRVRSLHQRAQSWRQGGAALHGAPMWRFISALAIKAQPTPAVILNDVDTWDDLRALES
ncbi:MAG: NTP transferase domain-containing protein [Bowdeniella nasicola]|nr:NTP transferase domain-containing protein [Bowdeniella nasicola]